jgi:hypothetical protein
LLRDGHGFREARNLSFLAASCCRVLVMKGGAGLRRRWLFLHFFDDEPLSFDSLKKFLDVLLVLQFRFFLSISRKTSPGKTRIPSAAPP